MKFPRDVIDYIYSFLPTMPFLPSLTLEPYELDREQILLWSTIFKNEQWLAEVTENTAKSGLIGS
jgi:hypothetical protein